MYTYIIPPEKSSLQLPITAPSSSCEFTIAERARAIRTGSPRNGGATFPIVDINSKEHSSMFRSNCPTCHIVGRIRL